LAIAIGIAGDIIAITSRLHFDAGKCALLWLSNVQGQKTRHKRHKNTSMEVLSGFYNYIQFSVNYKARKSNLLFSGDEIDFDDGFFDGVVVDY
jgi:hypothetical protein